MYYVLLIWLPGQKLLVEGLWGKPDRSNCLKSHQLWMSFFTAFLFMLWMSCVSKHMFFTSQPWHLSINTIMIVDITLKVLLKSLLDVSLYSFFLFYLFHSWFLRKMNTEYRSKFLSPAQYFYKDGAWSRIRSKVPNQVSILRKSEAWVCFVFWLLRAKKHWIVVFIRCSFDIVMLMTQAPKGEYTKKIKFWQTSIICSKKKDSVT